MKYKFLYKGILYTSLASIFWGLPQPIFFNEIKHVAALEIISHRSLWSFVFLLIIILFVGRIREFINIFKSKYLMFYLSITGLLITTNWTGFILSININRLQDASMGYYISPIISIGLGYLFLKEKISKLKCLSLTLMVFSIVFLLISMKTIPYLAILIALTWAFYGLIRKKINVSSEIGLLYESGFISIFAITYIIYLNFFGKSYFLNYNLYTSILLILTGAVTVFPLFFFNTGVKYLPLGLAGVIFYLAPTFHFITSILIFKEELNNFKLISFFIIWIAVIIFIFDNLKQNRKINENNIQLLS